MKVKLLEEYDKNQLVSSYAIPDIYNLIWILIRYGKTKYVNSDRTTNCLFIL